MKPSTQYMRATSFAILIISLVAVGALLAGLMSLLLYQAGKAGPPKQTYLLRLASLVMASLVLLLVIMLGVVARYIAQRLTDPQEKPKPTPYEDAWTEAGRRLRPEDAPPIEGFEDEGSDAGADG